MNGPTGLMVGAGKGVIRTMLCNSDHYVDVIPCDMAVNATIALAWSVGLERPEKPIFVNVTESRENTITWRYALESGKKHALANPFSGLLLLFLTQKNLTLGHSTIVKLKFMNSSSFCYCVNLKIEVKKKIFIFYFLFFIFHLSNYIIINKIITIQLFIQSGFQKIIARNDHALLHMNPPPPPALSS